jgi:hypothetical protein
MPSLWDTFLRATIPDYRPPASARPGGTKPPAGQAWGPAWNPLPGVNYPNPYTGGGASGQLPNQPLGQPTRPQPLDVQPGGYPAFPGAMNPFQRTGGASGAVARASSVPGWGQDPAYLKALAAAHIAVPAGEMRTEGVPDLGIKKGYMVPPGWGRFPLNVQLPAPPTASPGGYMPKGWYKRRRGRGGGQPQAQGYVVPQYEQQVYTPLTNWNF